MKTDNLPVAFAWSLPVALAGGGFLLPIEVDGISFYLFRVLVLIGALLGANAFFNNIRSESPVIKKFIPVLLIWLTAGLISFIYVLDQTEWMKDIFYLIIGISVFFSLYFIEKKNKQEAFLYGWITGYCCNLILGFYEMYSGNHLSGEFTKNLALLSPEHYTHFAPAGFFENPNHYGLYLTLTMLVFTRFKNFIPEKYFYLLVFLGIWQLFVTGSKFSILGLMLIAFYWIYIRQKDKKQSNKNTLIIIPVAILFFAIFFVSFNFKTVKFSNESEKARVELQKKNPDTRPTSGNLRKALLLNGIDFIKSSNGLGIGAGQFSVYIKKGKGKYDAGNLSDPHSGFMEIATQYGIPIVLVLVWFYIVWLRNLWKNHAMDEKIFGLIAIACIFILQNVNSGFISSPLAWFLLCFPVIWFHSIQLKK